MNNHWSDNIQSINLINMSRMMIMNREMSAFVVDKLGIKPGMKVLDVGTGTGEFISYLSACTEGVKYCGLDADKKFIEYAQSKKSEYCGTNEISFINGDAAELPYEDDFFDVVVSHTFLTAAICYEKAVDEMIRVCRDGGIIGTVNIADFAKMAKRDNGDYPWYAAYESYSGRIDRINSVASHINVTASGADEGRIMNLFSDHGLKDIETYPLGQFFSLSNHSLNEETRRKFIEYAYLNDIERTDRAEQISRLANKSFADVLDEEECREFRALAAEKRAALLAEIKDNSRWTWMGGNYLFVKAVVDKQLSHEDKPQDRFEKYRETKYKARKPKETVEHIKSCLDRAGIQTEMMPISSGVPGIYSCRVQIKGTLIGQNGKGTTPEYAYASGYAEFMERLQTGYLNQFDYPATHYMAPDAVMMSPEDSIVAGGRLLKSVLASVFGVPAVFIPVADVLQQWSFAARDGRFEMYPFTNAFTGEKEYLHRCILKTHVFTNGSCAGNTKKEALVQGISEIMERYAFLEILQKKLCAPLIPEEEIKRIPELWKLYKAIKREGDYDIVLIDASLGKGLPVTGAILINRASRTYTVRLGSHPRMETAVERTLTEMLQGRRLSNDDRMNPAGYRYEGMVQSELNKYNMLRTGSGVFSAELFGGDASWEYRSRDDVPEDIDGQYEYLLDKCRELGWNPYIRDCNFLGFDSYQVVIPEASVIFSRKAVSVEKGRAELKEVLAGYANCDRESRVKALNMMKLLNGYVFRDNIDWAAGRDYGRRLFGQVIGYNILHALEDIHEGDYVSAEKYLNKYNFNDRMKVLAEICMAKSQNTDAAKIVRYLERFYPKKYVSEAMHIIDNPFEVLSVTDSQEVQGE